MRVDEFPPTGTCDLTTTGRRSGQSRRIEIWYVVVDGRLALTGSPGPRDWLWNLRAHSEAVLHLRAPEFDLAVIAEEVTEPSQRRHFAEEAWRVQPEYADQPNTIDDWIASSPMVFLTPTQSSPSDD